MDHEDHVNLLKDGVPNRDGIWADFGAGAGAFTLALAELLGPNGEILAVDINGRALRRNEKALVHRFPETKISTIVTNFNEPINLPTLDGAIMANSLHFQKNKEKTLSRIAGYIRPGGRFIVVEYDTDRGNVWVPHPLSFRSWTKMAVQLGFGEPVLLDKYPGRFLNGIYSALSQL